jgi:hypothetical protein
VGANRKTILNSDPALDLADSNEPRFAQLRYCLSVPVTIVDELVGVLSFYSTSAFTEEHRISAETFATGSAAVFRHVTQADQGTDFLPFGGLNNLWAFERASGR